jgi:membrane-bound lytic murein transglycosylase D
VTPALLVHVVSQGDTLFAIARRYGVTVDDLRRANNLGSSDVIVPGQRLVVPRA